VESNQELVYTRAEAAQRAKLGLTTLDDLIRRNAFPVLRPSPRRVLIPARAFDAWLTGSHASDRELQTA
jgi:excisionase family DNA binding protein